MLSGLFSALAAASKFLPALWTSFPGPCEGRLPVAGSCPCRAAGWPPAGPVLQRPGPARSPVPGAGSRPSGGECGVRAARPPSLPPQA